MDCPGVSVQAVVVQGITEEMAVVVVMAAEAEAHPDIPQFCMVEMVGLVLF